MEPMDLLVKDLLDILEQIAPSSLAESWDNTGLFAGDPDTPVQSLLIALDPVSPLFRVARSRGANVIITHHPAIFHPLHSLRTDQPVGAFISQALQNDISIIGCHTNLDATTGGVSDVLAEGMQLSSITPLIPEKTNRQSSCGLGRIGDCMRPMKPTQCIERLRETCDPPWLLEAGPRPERVTRIAVCGGACSEFAGAAMKAGADLYITAEVKHSIARWAEEAGFWIIDGGHFATEQLILEPLRQRIEQELRKKKVSNRVYTARQQPPLTSIPE